MPSDFDTLAAGALAAVADVFGEPLIYTPPAGEAVAFLGTFAEAPPRRAAVEDGRFQTRTATATCLAADIEPEAGGLVTRSGETWTVDTPPRPLAGGVRLEMALILAESVEKSRRGFRLER